MLSVKRISKTDFIPVGIKEYISSKTKTVEVNGEIYTHTKNEIKEFDVESDFKNAPEETKDTRFSKELPYRRIKGNNWYTRDFDELVPFGYPVFSFWDSSMFYQSMYQYNSSLSGSENTDVKLFCSLIKLGAIKKYQITGIYYGKRDINEYNISVNDIIERSKIPFCIMSYGFNNTVSIDVNIMYFLKLDFSLFNGMDYYQNIFKSVTKQNAKLFPEKLFKSKLTDVEINSIAIEFLNHKINLKQKQLCNQ